MLTQPRQRNWEREALQRLRFEVLQWIRKQAGADRAQAVRMAPAAEELQVSREEIYFTVEDLATLGLVEYLGAGPKVRLTEAGVVHMEAAGRRQSIRV